MRDENTTDAPTGASETRVTVRGPLGVTSKVYPSMSDALADADTWTDDYAKQWRAMPWWWRAWSRVTSWIFGIEVQP